MRDIRDMEREAARIARLSAGEREEYDHELKAHRRALGLEDPEPEEDQDDEA